MRGFQVIHFTSVTSTQDIAKRIMKENVVIVAEEQRFSYGRGGRAWYSPPGGLWFTAIVRSERIDILPLLVAVAIARALEDLGVKVEIKWPNDIILYGKKLGGIIIENVSGLSLIGVGINVDNDIPEEVAGIAARAPGIDRNALLFTILDHLDSLLHESREKIIEEWKRRSNTLGREICVEDGGERICGFASDIGDDGALILQTLEGERRIYYGDVHVIQRED